ncbi:uncharacterized protein LOC142176102 [Nicotiana tabacum]|uniref:Uncharacterized protein LOC142176102 n=1 Tax=Nicotiana tabacum TaxID=4097 RepID=A0AC58TPW9_TOBAC
MMYKFIKTTDEKVESQSSTIKNLEIQMSQLATLMSGTIQGALPSNTEQNPKEHLKVISLRSGKSLDDPYTDREEKLQEVEKMKREKLDKQFSKFLDILKQLYINIPFTHALTQMPSYAKFLKEILKLELGEMKDTGVSLQLADQSAKIPKGIIENILVRVDKFVFPVDFIVLEMEENTKVPLILGRPFIATGRAIIDVHQGQLILRVDEERVIFDMQKMMKFPGDESSSSCFQIDLLDDLVNEYKDNQLIIDSLERCLARSGTIGDDNPIIREEAEILEKESENEKVSQEGIQLKIELKDLPSHLKYVFLEPELFPVIISSFLTIEQENKLIGVLRKHKIALGWTVADIKGISPAICMHMILMENNYKPIV